MPAAGRSHPSLPNVTTRGEGGDVVTDREQTSTGSHVADRPAVGRGRGGAEAPVRRDAMTRREDEPRQWAYLLIVGGLVLLAMQLGRLGWLSDWLWAAVFLAGGAAFAYQYRVDPQRWWALIPGAALPRSASPSSRARSAAPTSSACWASASPPCTSRAASAGGRSSRPGCC